MRLVVAGVVAAMLGAPAGAQTRARDDLLLKDFEPRSMLKVPVHEVERAAFPVIDVHNHVNDGRGEEQDVPPDELLARMDQLNVKHIVILTGRWGDDLQRVMDTMITPYPGRFTVCAEPDWSRIDEPGFGEAMARQMHDSAARGARCLKVTKVLGLQVRDASGALVPVDDPRLDPMWAACGRLGMPVFIHSADPDAFFEPVDAHNERWDELGEHPDWSFHGPEFPSKREILDARDRVFARHPGTTFVALHVANHPEDLDDVSSVLDRHPNVHVEIGARQAELGRQPRRARAFFLRYADRIMFGTDMTPRAPLYRNYFRFLETADEHFDYWGSPGQGRWKISGLDLPPDVLERVYSRNAERVLGISTGPPSRTALRSGRTLSGQIEW
jgi:predicted TIM-barrel fold metal-dependent hydrolase